MLRLGLMFLGMFVFFGLPGEDVWGAKSKEKKNAEKVVRAVEGKKKKRLRQKARKKRRARRRRRRRRNRKKRPLVFRSVTVGQRSPEDPFRSPRSISVLDQKTIEERRPRSTPEALQETPGVFLQKTNHGGGAPIIRGAVGPQVLILVDGVRLNTSTYRSGPNQYLNLLDPWSIGRLEVLKGPGSLAYGSYAFGGVLNIRTQKALVTDYGEWKGEARLIGRYGSSDQERTGFLSLSGGFSGVSVQLSVAYGEFGDLRAGAPTLDSSARQLLKGKENVIATKNSYGDLVLRPETGGQAFSGYENLYVGSKIKWRIRPGWSIVGVYRRAQLMNQGRADQFAAKRSMRFYDNTLDFGYLRLNGSIPSASTRFRVTVSAQGQSEHVYRRRFDAGEPYVLSRENLNDDKVNVLGVSADGHTRAFSWLKFNYGVDFYYDTVESKAEQRKTGGTYQVSTPTYPEGVNYATLGGHLAGRLRVARWGEGWGLYLHLGDRLNGFFANAPARETFDAVAFQQFGNALYGAAQLLLSRRFNLSFSYSEGFRAPNLQESAFIGDAGNNFEIPNPDLKPEISRTLELTLRAQAKRYFYGWVTGYYSFWNNLIDSASSTYNGQDTVGGKPVKMRVNRANAAVMGVEAGVGIRRWRGWSLSAHMTWTRGRAYDEGGKETPLSRIPPFFGRVLLRRDFGRWAFVEAYVNFADRQSELSQRDRDDPRVPVCDGKVAGCVDGTPGWWTLNVRGGVKMSRHANLIFQVENIFDMLYKPHTSGVYGAGLSARLALELKI